MREETLLADPRILRAVAHPVRTALLYELYARGSGNATVLAASLDKPVNAISFHLRQLAKYGLIQESPRDASDGRQRWWRPASRDGLRLPAETLSASREGRAALSAFQAHAAAYWQALVGRFFDEHVGEEVWWNSDVPMRLTHDEARQLSSELFAVLDRWRQRGTAAPGNTGSGAPRTSDAERATYLALVMLLPHQGDLTRQQ